MSSFLSKIMEKQRKAEKDLRDKYGDDFDKPHPHSGWFGLNNAEVGVIEDWLKSLKPELLKLQKKDKQRSAIAEEGEIYYGATGGGLTYCFTPTSLGTIIVVKETLSGKELNVSDATHWHFYG